jgi:hypothetical protein
MSEDLWKRVETAFYLEPSREKAIAAVDINFRKNFPTLPLSHISEETCGIRFERLTFEMLASLKLRHTIDTPARLDGIFVIVEHNGQYYVVDGTKRINRWKNRGTSATDEAVVISRRKP